MVPFNLRPRRASGRPPCSKAEAREMRAEIERMKEADVLTRELRKFAKVGGGQEGRACTRFNPQRTLPPLHVN